MARDPFRPPPVEGDADFGRYRIGYDEPALVTIALLLAYKGLSTEPISDARRVVRELGAHRIDDASIVTLAGLIRKLEEKP